MKKIPCSYEGCSNRRVHYTLQDETRDRKLVEVEDDYQGDAFCSLTCAMLAGRLSARQEGERK